MGMLSPSELTGLAEEVTPRAVDLRRRLHQIPEPAHEEHETTALLSSVLEDGGLAPNRRQPRTGLWVDVGGEPRVGFRCDLDALPIFEPNENTPRSRNEGWMHACGHDAHAAIALSLIHI